MKHSTPHEIRNTLRDYKVLNISWLYDTLTVIVSYITDAQSAIFKRKVAGSIPYGIFELFYWLNPSGRIMALGPTPSLTEMSTRDLSERLRRPNLATFMCRLPENPGSLNVIETPGPI
jgi:hypothetical protein